MNKQYRLPYHEEISWIKRAYDFSQLSQDPSTQIGTVIVKDGVLLSFGYNRLPKGCNATKEQYDDRDWKYCRVIHAETAAIIEYARVGSLGPVGPVGLQGSTMYATWACCENCANDIAEAGIKCVVSHSIPAHRSHSMWIDTVEKGIARLKECGVEYHIIEHRMGERILFNRELIDV